MISLPEISGAMGKANSDFYERVYALVRQIPRGKVSTYGNIAETLGLKSAARTVGYALNAVQDRVSIPCQRVVNRNGELTGRHHFPEPDYMRRALESEGVEFIGDKVNMKKHFYNLKAESK